MQPRGLWRCHVQGVVTTHTRDAQARALGGHAPSALPQASNDVQMALHSAMQSVCVYMPSTSSGNTVRLRLALMVALEPRLCQILAESRAAHVCLSHWRRGAREQRK